jgi:hypothetical protein
MPENWMHRSKANGSHREKKIWGQEKKTDEFTAKRNWDASIDRKLADHNKANREQQDVAPLNKMPHIV